MTTSKNNITLEKTSFLQGSNSSFIKDQYLVENILARLFPL